MYSDTSLFAKHLFYKRMPCNTSIYKTQKYGRSPPKYHNHELMRWLKQHRPGWTLEVKRSPEGSKGFVVVPKRWVVERTFAWMGRNRRLSKDYEKTISSSEAMVKLSNIALLLRRLAPAEKGRTFGYRGKWQNARNESMLSPNSL